MNSNDTEVTILAVDRALVILKFLARRKTDMGVRDISRELGYSPAVTQKILNTFKAHSFVQQDLDTQRYQLGTGALHVGLAVLEQTDLLKVARPKMIELTNKTGETTFLALQDEYRTVYIDRVKSPHPIRMDAEIGAHRPMNCTAVGKILLAFGPPGSVSAAFDSGAFVKSTSNSIVDLKMLEMELERVREQRYAIDNEEYNSEAMCVAAPIFGPNCQICAAITTSGPSFRMKHRVSEIIDLVKAQAAEISAQLGYKELNQTNSSNQSEN